MTLPYSGAIYVQAFPRECTETFLEGHRRAFEYLGGVPRRISYYNSAIAVIEVFKGREQKLTKEFLRLQSHYLFQEHFCLVRRPNEKGHVERLLGFARRGFLVPVPQVDSLETLNRQLLDGCQADLQQRTRGKQAPKKPYSPRTSTSAPRTGFSFSMPTKFSRPSYSRKSANCWLAQMGPAPNLALTGFLASTWSLADGCVTGASTPTAS